MMTVESDRLHVLVVDDNIDAAASLCGLLQHMDCETMAAVEVRSALQAAAEFKPEVVILDLEMPGADGCQILKEMKEMPGGPKDAFYVCLTGSNESENRRRCEEAGFHRFFNKPIWMQELAQIKEEGRARLLLTRNNLNRRRSAKRTAL